MLARTLALLCLLAGLSLAQVPSAAVFPLEPRGVDSNSTRIIEDALSDGLMRTGKMRLLERSQMKTIMQEQGFQQSGTCDGSECAVQVGKVLGVQIRRAHV
jgi:curli biogenesis system outer membrane secretion channel CsgG